MTDYYKYARTPHLPFSGGATEDDRTFTEEELHQSLLASCDDVVVSLKLDGENTNWYNDHYHARSIDSRHHPSRSWAKQRWEQVRHEIPESWKIVLENVFAEHTIRYESLESYVFVISIWDDKRVSLSWDQTLEWCELLGLHHVPVLYRGPFDLKVLQEIASSLDPQTQEGFVVRNAGTFSHDEFDQHVAKYVTSHFKAELANSDDHWMHQEVVPNGLAPDR